MENFLKGVQIDLRSALVRNCPVDNGLLKNSIEVLLDGNSLKIYMFDYGIMVDLGTKPHIIRPKNKKALHWGGKNGPVVKEVHHPGFEGTGWIRNVFYHKLKTILKNNLEMHLPGADIQVKFDDK